MLESQTLMVDGQSVHCVTGGEGPPLLFLHGWPTHSGLYRNIMPSLVPHRRTIAIDLPGFGQSSKPTDVRYDFPFFSGIIDGVLEQLRVGRVGLVVHDLGGPIGLYWGVENRDRVSELVVLNTLAFADFHWMVKVFVASVSLPGVAQAITSPMGIRASMRFGMKTRPAREVLDVYSAPFAQRPGRRALALAGRQLSPRKLGRAAKKLSSLDVPTLLMYGTDDKILPDVAKTMNRLSEIWPHAAKVRLPGLGHFLQEDGPELVSKHLVRFVRRDA